MSSTSNTLNLTRTHFSLDFHIEFTHKKVKDILLNVILRISFYKISQIPIMLAKIFLSFSLLFFVTFFREIWCIPQYGYEEQWTEPSPIYLGCFEIFTSEFTNETQVDFMTLPANKRHYLQTPHSCIEKCRTAMHSNFSGNFYFDLALVKGSLCACSLRTAAEQVLRQVSSNQCNFPCEFGNLTCGSNVLPYYSTYCLDKKTCSSSYKIQIYSVEEKNNSSLELLQPCIPCSTCEYCSFPIPRDECKEIALLHDNSPTQCIEYCRKYLTESRLKDGRKFNGDQDEWNNFQAVLGWLSFLPICYCRNLTDHEGLNFEPAEEFNCNCSCPGNESITCGGKADPGFFVHYNLTLPTAAPEQSTEPTTTITITTTDFVIIESTPTTATSEPTTMPTSLATSTPLESLTPSATSTPLESSTSSATSTPLESSTSSATSSNNEPEPAPIISTSTSSNSIIISTSVQPDSPATTKSNTDAPILECEGEQKCEQMDHEHTHWVGCPGQIVYKGCSGNSTGQMSWYCGKDGKFIGRPNYSKCSTIWIDIIQDYIADEQSLPYSMAYGLILLIHKSVELAQKNHTNFDVKYYGHEMNKILTLTTEIMEKLDKEDVNIDRFENVTDYAMAIFEHVFVNQELWLQMSRKECTKLGSYFITSLEDGLLALSTLVAGTSFNEDQKDYIRRYDDHSFKQIVGVKSTSEESVRRRFIFPPNSNLEKDSYIELPRNWLSQLNNNDDGDGDDISGIEFVGIQLDPYTSNYLFPVDDRIYDSDDNYYDDDVTRVMITEDKIVNGKIMSFSFGKDSTATAVNFSTTAGGVKIILRHNVTAWGSDTYQVRRKLHDGEPRKAVQGSAKCAFWNPESELWSTDGCVLVETAADRTVCECFHLTAFALLMDLHDYVGRDIGLEILTWILTPLSIICLLLTIFILATLKTINHQPRSIITRHLSICLLIGMFLMLTLMDKHYILTSDIICTLTAIALHYTLSAAFMWMLFEGILLYRMIVLVFETGHNYIKYQMIGAYGIPLIIVAATLVASEFGNGGQAYGGDQFCWLEGNYIFAFLGPVALIMMANCLILITSLKTAYSLQKNSPSLKLSAKKKSNYITLVHGSFSIAILLGVTWAFGYAMLINNYAISNTAAYIFTILNASQGIFLFYFHCFANTKVREALGSRYSFLHRFNSKTIPYSTGNLHTNSNSGSTESGTSGSIQGGVTKTRNSKSSETKSDRDRKY